MTDHERLMAAARASWVAAHALAPITPDPEGWVRYDQAQHLDRIHRLLLDERRAHANERHANREMRRAVITYGARLRIVVWVLIVLVLVGGGVAFYLIERNTAAIRVSCTLLTNTILESGAGGSDQAPTSPAAKAQREITAIYVGAITRELLSPAERKAIRRRSVIVAKAGGVLSTPDCDEVASDPDRVTEQRLSPTREPPRRSPATRRPASDAGR